MNGSKATVVEQEASCACAITLIPKSRRLSWRLPLLSVISASLYANVPVAELFIQTKGTHITHDCSWGSCNVLCFSLSLHRVWCV